MSAFLPDAEWLLEAAGVAPDPEFTTPDLAILIGRDGANRMMDAGGWMLDALQADSGARTVYRISRQSGRIRVEGRCGANSCALEAAPAPFRLADRRQTFGRRRRLEGFLPQGAKL